MQNVVNLLCPFFRNRLPIVGGKVYFVKPSTAAQNFSQVAGIDFADYVAIYDKNHVLLENPMPLNDEGFFETQPFVNDGVEYKMIVCYPTGLPALLNDDTPCWEVAYTIDSKTGSVTIHYDGIACVDSISELSELGTECGIAVVRGYGSANDFCPPRFFEWVPDEDGFNRGTVIRSLRDDSGAWVLQPNSHVDVRWFGVDQNGNSDYTEVLVEIAQDCADYPVYFPAGTYRISNHLHFKNVIAERGAWFVPTEETNSDLKFEVERVFEDRGAKFQNNELSRVVYPVINGTLRTSLLPSPANAALTANALAGITELVVDSIVALESGSTVTVSNKKVLVRKNRQIPSGMTLDGTCCVYFETTGDLRIKELTVNGDWKVSIVELNSVEYFAISNGGGGTPFRISVGEAYFAAFALLTLGFSVGNDYDNSWMLAFNDPDGWTGFVLKAVQAKIGTLKASGCTIDSGTVNLMQRVNDKYIAVVEDDSVNAGEGTVTYLEAGESDTSESFTSYKVPIDNVLATWNDAPLINVLIRGNAGHGLELVLPGEEKDAIIYVHNPKGVAISANEYTLGVPSMVKFLGIFSLGEGIAHGPERFCMRKPTANERARYNLPSSTHWIADPLTT